VCVCVCVCCLVWVKQLVELTLGKRDKIPWCVHLGDRKHVLATESMSQRQKACPSDRKHVLATESMS
jgi:hypothetical protein